jgi:putative transposase
MIKRQAFKVELMPDPEAIRKMNCFAGCCRFVANKVLVLQKENHEAGGKFLSYFTLAKELTGWRDSQELNFLKEAPYHCLQHAIKHVIQAFKNFFHGGAESKSTTRGLQLYQISTF